MIVVLTLLVLVSVCATDRRPCVCTRELDPVCGSNGKTYNNPCELNCDVNETGTPIEISRTGRCEGDLVLTPFEELCVCTYEYRPVCASNGQTYPNKCSLDCEISKNADLKQIHKGQCETEIERYERTCPCYDYYKPVCGSDGQTYSNRCSLDCEIRKRPDLALKREGHCHDPLKVEE